MKLPHLRQIKPEFPAEAIGFASDLMAGLHAWPRRVSPKYFYDAQGSALFERICELPEYYPTRTELDLLHTHAPQIAQCIGPQADIVEFGAGASRKIRRLLDALHAPARFIPVDISGEHLHDAAERLRADYPRLTVHPLVADFTQSLILPKAVGRRVGFFPGSSIGNFDPQDAQRLLQRMAGWLEGGGLLIGVDLIKSPQTLHAAYNDDQGITAAFNRNLLVRANRELNANFEVDHFAHYAFYNPVLHRIEMHLISDRTQQVTLGGETITFAQGDTLHTESSYKYTVEGFQELARSAGFTTEAVWTDAQQHFSLHWLTVPRH
ncbi:MAG: L-histidine N(alpha)-methyltransferase [Pseudomonadota bacterium]